MTGLSDRIEAQALDDIFADTCWLAILRSTAAPGERAGTELNDDGTFPDDLEELDDGGYARLQIDPGEWDAAIGGSPTIKVLQTPGTITPSGVDWEGIVAYAFVAHASAAITLSNLISGGLFLDANNDPAVIDRDDGDPFVIPAITERLGDPPIGVDPT
jgi:hypothetical protein